MEDSEIKPIVYHVAVSTPLERGPWFGHKAAGKKVNSSPLLQFKIIKCTIKLHKLDIEEYIPL